MTMASLLPNTNSDDMEIKPGIAEMIREEERVSTQIFTIHNFSFNYSKNIYVYTMI